MAIGDSRQKITGIRPSGKTRGATGFFCAQRWTGFETTDETETAVSGGGGSGVTDWSHRDGVFERRLVAGFLSQTKAGIEDQHGASTTLRVFTANRNHEGEKLRNERGEERT